MFMPALPLSLDALLQGGKISLAFDEVQVTALDEARGCCQFVVQTWPSMRRLERQRPFARVASLLTNAAGARPRSAWRNRGSRLLVDAHARTRASQVIGDRRTDDSATNHYDVQH